ncbi:HD domain-containing protein, partial [Coprobacillus cateniformis]|uniref:HD domain-containing protein n=1 Tax=Coprobacillus cateniformis TaxID=100884 RepID=UPI003F633EAE
MNKENFSLRDIEMNEKRVLRDAIHDYIHVDHLVIWHLINSQEMQRLRRVKQLGGTYQVFQSAEHSRFVHSLGVYQVVRRMLETECLDNELNDYDKLCVMCAGLLHDIGHGPFSHSFEGVFKEDHENITVRMILEDSEVHNILITVHEDLPTDIAAIIQHTHKNQILIQMVSSQLDADRMDYLLRDSYMTGTTYGQFDMSRILRTMRICDGKIVYKESGVQAIENYILARYHMYWQVYYHPTARSYEHLLP